MIILGIDPGITGAIAKLNGRSLEVDDIPVAGKRVEPQALFDRLWRYVENESDEVRAFIERAQAMPKQGVASTFNYGMTYGMLLAGLAAAEIPYEEVSAAKWKRALRISKEKDVARRRASELMPQGASCWPLKKHHNRAEAALIAWWGKEQLTAKS